MNLRILTHVASDLVKLIYTAKMAPVTMKAVGVEKYGEIDNLIEKEVEIPKAKGHDVLIK